MAAMMATIAIAYTGHLAFPLFKGQKTILPAAQMMSLWAPILALSSIISGNWAYTRYRAPIGGARAWLRENTPLVHYLFMEYHEFTVLFTLPLGVACAWILWRYDKAIFERQNRGLLMGVCVALMAMMFFAVGGFVSGLAVAKTHAL